MDQPFHSFKAAVEPPAKAPDVELRSTLRILGSIAAGLCIVIVAVAAIVS